MSNMPTVLIDFDDTLSDPIPFFLQFTREIGGSLSDRFGGEPAAWDKAAVEMLHVVQDDYLDRFVGNPTAGYLEWLRALRFRSMRLVCDAMAVSVPPDVERLSLEVQFEALSRCHAGFPGAEQALAELAEHGYPLHMASGQESEYLRGGLTGQGLTRFFGRLFGPDLIDCAKEGTEYYTRVFAALGVRSDRVIVVDDYPPAIGWAVAAGAQVIQAKLSPHIAHSTQPGVAAVVTDLRDLPRLVANMTAPDHAIHGKNRPVIGSP